MILEGFWEGFGEFWGALGRMFYDASLAKLNFT
jgi:hypothetical protein